MYWQIEATEFPTDYQKRLSSKVFPHFPPIGIRSWSLRMVTTYLAKSQVILQ